MKAINYQDFREICPEVFILLDDKNVKFITQAYGWSNDTLMIFAEEHRDKHCFYICKNRRSEVDHDRRYIYYIKPNTIEILENSSFKIPLIDKRVIRYDDPYKLLLDYNKSKEFVKELTNKIEEVNTMIEHFQV